MYPNKKCIEWINSLEASVHPPPQLRALIIYDDASAARNIFFFKARQGMIWSFYYSQQYSVIKEFAKELGKEKKMLRIS